MTHSQIVDKAAKWLKNHKGNIHTPNCPLVVKELDTLNHSGEIPDVIGWCYCLSVLIEVKTSYSDFLHDKNKRHKKYSIGMGQQRYFCCPFGMIKTEELPDKWGLLTINQSGKIELVKGAEMQEADLNCERTMLLSIIRRNKK